MLTIYDDLARVNVEHLPFDQEAVDHRIEVAVVLDIVDMAVDIVIHPARGNRMKVPIGFAPITDRKRASPGMSGFLGFDSCPTAMIRKRAWNDWPWLVAAVQVARASS